MKQYTMTAKPRQAQERGKNYVGRLRRSGLIPGNLISGGKSSLLSFSEKDFTTLVNSGLCSSSLIGLHVEGTDVSQEQVQVVVKEVHRDPIDGNLLHVDFYQVTKSKPLIVEIGIVSVGIAKGIKAGGALEHYIRSVKVRTTPEALKETIELDISSLDVGQAILFKDLKLPVDWEVLNIQENSVVLRIARARVATAVTEEEKESAGETAAVS